MPEDGRYGIVERNRGLQPVIGQPARPPGESPGLSAATGLQLHTTAEEVDPLDVALRTGDRSRGHRLGPGNLARLHEHVADVLQVPAHLLDLADKSLQLNRGVWVLCE